MDQLLSLPAPPAPISVPRDPGARSTSQLTSTGASAAVVPRQSSREQPFRTSSCLCPVRRGLRGSPFGQKRQAAAAMEMPTETRAASAETQETDNTAASPEVLNLWRSADAICFDVDSTVCVDEGIDELAAFCGVGDAVAAWTTRAMTGNTPFEVALAARLDIMKPTARQLAMYLATTPPKLSPGIKDLVAAIKQNGAEVYLVSGGFRQMIEPVAAILGIPKEQIFANKLLFDCETGEYVGFDEAEFTSRAGGKAKAIEAIKKDRGFKTLIMIGDGATDLEARRPGGADAFIGYGGVQIRPTVQAQADWFVTGFDDLINSLRRV